MRNIRASNITWDGTLCLWLTDSEIKMCVFYVCVWIAAALMRWQVDPLRTVAGGANRPETVSRSPPLQLRGECVALCWLHTAADWVALLTDIYMRQCWRELMISPSYHPFISKKQLADRFLLRLYYYTAFFSLAGCLNVFCSLFFCSFIEALCDVCSWNVLYK